MKEVVFQKLYKNETQFSFLAKMVLKLKNGKQFQVSCPEGYIKKEYKFYLIKQICKTEDNILL